MKTRKLAEKGLALALTGLMLGILMTFSSGARAGPLLQGPVTVEGVADVAPVLHYQGRLLDPATGNPKPEGRYQMTFSIYEVESRGTPLWSETKDVTVSANGLFTVLLGDTRPLDPPIFNGRQLWLGVTVGSDPEAAPRQRIAHVAYALHAQQATNADLLGGQNASAFASASHTHDDRYFTEGESDARFVNASGDTMTGVLTVPRIAYSAPRTQYFMIGSAGFVPGSNVDYFNTYGNGGAYIVSGSGALVAPVHLPQGAVVTEFKVFFYDNSASDMTVYLDREGVSSSYFIMAEVTSAGISGYGSKSTTTISGNPINNTTGSYLVYAYSAAWDSNLRIKGALITYTISEAP